MMRRLTRLALAPPALSLLLCLANAAQERRFADEELRPLATSLAEYVEARASALDVDAARSTLADNLAQLGSDVEDADPLRYAADLGRALWLSRNYHEERLRRGKVTEEVFAHEGFAGAGMEFAYRVPRDYSPREAAYPLILTIPARGETPAEHIWSRWTLSAVLDGAILLCPAMPTDRDWDRVMVAGRPGGLSHVLTALRIATERFAVDFDRVYVVGHGKGVPTAVAAGNYSPERFAGIAGRGGDVAAQGPENFGNLPTYFAGAGAKAVDFQSAASRAGFGNCRLDPTGREQDLWDWILEHPRRT